MSKSDRPSWLSQALEASKRSTATPFPDEGGARLINRGEIRALRPMGLAGSPRLVLILTTSDEGWANTMLLTNEIEAATNHDVRLDPDETRLPFPVLAETDIVGPAFVVQFGPLLGRVDDAVITLIHRVKQGDDSHVLADRRGLPVLSRKENRVRWKEEELQAFHDLAGDCFAELMLKEQERTPVLADPELFEDLDSVAPVEKILDLLELADIGNLDVPLEHVSDRESLTSWIMKLDPMQMSALEPIWRGALREAESGEARNETVEFEPARERTSVALARRIAERAAQGERSIPIATKESFWESEEHEGIVRMRLSSGEELQLSPIFLERQAA